MELSQRFEHEGQSVAWDRIGEGPPLVMIHGFPWNSGVWRRIAPCVAPFRTVYLFDMLGTGASTKSAGKDVRPQVQNDLLAALISYWGLERPEVVAHDFGGLAALRGLFVNRLAYSRLTLFDAVAVLPSGSPFFAHVWNHEDAFAGMPAYAHQALFQAYVQNAAAREIAPDAMALYRDPYSGEAGQPAFYRQIAQANEAAIEELQPLYRDPGIPVRLFWGEEDTFIPPHQGDELAGLLGAARPERIPGAAHLVQEDAPERVVAAILRDIA